MEPVLLILILILVILVLKSAVVSLLKYWYLALLAGGLIAALFYLTGRDLKKLRRQEAEAARKAEELARLQEHRNRQQDYRRRMIILGEQSIELFESLPKHLQSAEEYLDRAEIDFSENAFDPFWDSIEKAVARLGRFSEDVQQIKKNSSSHADLLTSYENEIPDFPIARKAVDKLLVGVAVAERMRAIVRTAQRNFQFASIYRQRRTSQILVAGFANLAEAFEQMEGRIMLSINNLSSSLGAMASGLNESMRALEVQLSDIAESGTQQYDQLMATTIEGSERIGKALEVLDSIQHHGQLSQNKLS